MLTVEKGPFWFLILPSVLLLLLYPFIGLLLISLISCGYRLNLRLPPFVPLVLIFVELNWSRDISSDLVWYIEFFRLLGDLPLMDLFDAPVLGVQAKESEIVFYALVKVLSVATGSSYLAFSFVTTVAIYTAVIISIGELTKHCASTDEKHLAIILGLTVGIVFTLTNQLIRQYLAGGAFLLGATLLLNRQFATASVVWILGALIHNSVVVPMVGFLLVASIWGFRRLHHEKLYVIVVPIIYLALNFMVGLGDLSEQSLISTYDGEIFGLVVAADGLLIATTTMALRKFSGYQRSDSELLFIDIAQVFIAFSLSYYVFVVGLYDSPLLSLRFYFYMDFVRVASITILVAMFPARRINPLLVLSLALFVGLGHVAWRIERSPFDYGGNVWTHLSSHIVEITERVGRYGE